MLGQVYKTPLPSPTNASNPMKDSNAKWGAPATYSHHPPSGAQLGPIQTALYAASWCLSQRLFGTRHGTFTTAAFGRLRSSTRRAWRTFARRGPRMVTWMIWAAPAEAKLVGKPPACWLKMIQDEAKRKNNYASIGLDCRYQ